MDALVGGDGAHDAVGVGADPGPRFDTLTEEGGTDAGGIPEGVAFELEGAALAADVLGKKQDVASVQGASLNVDGSGGKVVLNGSINVTKPDVLAGNGVIHVIDGVLLPTLVDTAIGYDDGAVKFSTLVAAVKAAGLVARDLPEPVIFWNFSTVPSFSVYRQAVTHLAEPAPGELALTRIDRLPPDVPVETLFQRGGVVLVRRPPTPKP